MIINCECGKRFNIDKHLIPEKGRLLKCGSCSKVWHYIPPAEDKIEINPATNNNEAINEEKKNKIKPDDNILESKSQINNIDNNDQMLNKNDEVKNEIDLIKKSSQKKSDEPSLYENFEISKINNFNTSIDKKKKTKHKNQRKDLKFNLSLTNITSSLIILIITFVSIILILDTFKNNISIYIPILIPLIESLYETLRDINFFIVDLIT